MAKNRIRKIRKIKNAKRTSNVNKSGKIPNVDTSKSKQKKEI